MQGYSLSTYGDRIAEIFDDWVPLPADSGQTIDFLVALAGEGPMLELGVGTGRIAIPLAARGVEVTGIEVSQAMINRLLSKPGGDAVRIAMGDFADVAVAGRFKLVYAVFSTLFLLQSQDEQLRCFRNVTDHLTDDGLFVTETLVPTMAQLSQRETTETISVDIDHVWIYVSRNDRVRQLIERQQVHITEAGIRLYPVQHRYAWPSEMDLMARLAGLRLRERWGGYQCQPFTDQSTLQVSVYARQNG